MRLPAPVAEWSSTGKRRGRLANVQLRQAGARRKIAHGRSRSAGVKEAVHRVDRVSPGGARAIDGAKRKFPTMRNSTIRSVAFQPQEMPCATRFQDADPGNARPESLLLIDLQILAMP